MNLNLTRQSKLIPEDKLKEYCIKVFGVGSVGSHVVKILAKTGFSDIEVYDMDTVEEENISAQAYDFRHIKQTKVEALANICEESAGIKIKAINGLIDESSVIEPLPKTIYCCFFDSFEARKLVYNKLKDYPIMFVDARIGRYDMHYYFVDCSNTEEKENYEKTFPKGTGSELVCGEKASAPINVQIAGRIVMNIVNYISDKDYTKKYLGNASATSKEINILNIRTNAD